MNLTFRLRLGRMLGLGVSLLLGLAACEGAPVPPSPTVPPTAVPTPTNVPASPTVASSAVNPFAGTRWFVDPAAPAARQAATWRADRPADAALMDTLAAQPQADWFGEWSGDIQAAVEARVTQITAAGGLPVFVAYNIPNRDCGQYSAGGAAAPAAYRAWIAGFAAGIGTRRAVIILEPDALAQLKECLSATDQQSRLDLIREAVQTFKANPGTAVYLDAGHSRWIAAPDMAERLQAAGVAEADGFALNVSNYMATADLIAFGRDVSGRSGGKHFVLDTSRNGNGPTPDYQWCNPAGRAIGPFPTTATADPLVDAYLWIKRPGESDGTCNGGPAAGQWWPDKALELARNAQH